MHRKIKSFWFPKKERDVFLSRIYEECMTPGSISIISDKRELAGMGEIRMEEKRHSFFVKNTNLFVGVDFIYKHTHTHTF